MVNGRDRLGLSSRDLAARAGISQAYVVRLERASTPGAHPRPTPTVDVLARLAEALQLQPADLLADTLRRAGRHVLLVTDSCVRHPLDHVSASVRESVDTWLSASSNARQQPVTRIEHRPIELRRGPPRAYDPRAITDSLQHELHVLADDLHGRQLGMIFPEVSHVMRTLANPSVVIEFEHRWADVVSSAATALGAHAAWNVCVYDVDALRATDNRVDVTIDLVRSHDTIWSVRNDRLLTGVPAVRRILGSLRPANQSVTEWRAATDRVVEELGMVA